jgi:hypothetical protein
VSETNRDSNGRAEPCSRVRGRPFEKGNGGRKPGSKNRTTVVAEALLKGEEEALVRKAIELALAGDVPLLKFLLDRLLPKQRSVQLEIPDMIRADNAVDALAAITKAVANGDIAPSEAAPLATLIDTYARAIKVQEHESRLDKVELGS